MQISVYNNLWSILQQFDNYTKLEYVTELGVVNVYGVGHQLIDIFIIDKIHSAYSIITLDSLHTLK